MANKEIRLPVTVFHDGAYRAPGTPLSLEEKDADRLVAIHGEFDGPRMQDQGNTQTMNVQDAKSIADLNTFTEINKGFGVARDPIDGSGTQTQRLSGFVDNRTGANSGQAITRDQQEALLHDDDLEKMNKGDLTAYAEGRGVTVDAGDTKAEIVAKMKAAQKK